MAFGRSSFNKFRALQVDENLGHCIYYALQKFSMARLLARLPLQLWD